jgi:hypothetical protein
MAVEPLALLLFIREFPNPNLGRKPAIATDIYMIFLSPAKHAGILPQIV